MSRQLVGGVLAGAMVWAGWAPAAWASPMPVVPAPPHIAARAAILIDGNTGAILYEKNAFRQMDPASLTKMMTAYLVIRHDRLQQTVPISRRASNTGGSRLHIQTGQQYTVYDLLRGLLLRSGNDAAVALAEATAGTVPRFVAQMNLAAQQLGAFNTHFENPNGLTAPGHYSSAYDLARIAEAAMKLPTFRQIVGSGHLQVQEQRHRATRTIHNTNRLLYEFPGAIGIKTGTTNAAGKCLAAAAQRSGQYLVAILLNSPDRWGQAAHLLQWGFRHWRTDTVIQRGQKLRALPVVGGTQATVEVAASRNVRLTLPHGGEYRLVFSLPREVAAPVKVQTVGKLYVLSPVQPPQVVPLVTVRSVAAKSRPRRWWEWVSRVLGFLNYQDGAG